MKVVLSIIVSLMLMFSACTKVILVKSTPPGKSAGKPGNAPGHTGAPGQNKKAAAPAPKASPAKPAPAKPGNAPGHSGAPGQQKKK